MLWLFQRYCEDVPGLQIPTHMHTMSILCIYLISKHRAANVLLSPTTIWYTGILHLLHCLCKVCLSYSELKYMYAKGQRSPAKVRQQGKLQQTKLMMCLLLLPDPAVLTLCQDVYCHWPTTLVSSFLTDNKHWFTHWSVLMIQL